DFQGREAGRPAHRGTDAVLPRDQPWHGQSDGAPAAAGVVAARRPGDRMIRRRKLLAALGAAALSAAFPSLAQQRSKPWRIGVLASRSRPSSPDDPYASFAKGMSEFGYVEGKDYVYDWVYADGHYERLSELAAELVRRKVDIIVATSSVGAQAA